MSILKRLAGQTALYGLSSMLGRALNFLLVPFYTSVLLVGEFGVFTEMYAYVAFLNVVYLFGMETTYFRYANKDQLKEKEVFQVTQTFVCALALLLSGTFIILAKPIANALDYPNQSRYIVWLALIMGVDAIAAIPFARLRQENKAAWFAFVKLTNIGLNIFFNIFFLVFCKGISEGLFLPEYKELINRFYHSSRDIEYVFIANFLANAAVLLLLVKEFRGFRFRWNTEMMQSMIWYAFPLMLMGLAGQVNEVLDRILLKPLLPDGFYPGLSKEVVLGIYGGCYKLSMFMTLAIQSFRYAADPFFFSKAQDKNAPAVFARVMNWFVVVCCFMFLMISVYVAPIGELLLRKELFSSGLAVVPVLLLANLFLGVYYNLSIWYKITDKTYWGTWIGVGGALFTIFGNILLIPLLGYMGAAYTTLACYFLMALISYRVGHKYFPVPYDIAAIVMLVGSSVLLIMISRYVNTGNFWLNQLVCLIFPMAYLLLVVYLKKIRFGKVQ
ncbi:MAG TPA: polysaccharide biosynthesis C-terminal domain-containing protein [Cytophagaceae bacterium]|jgi:O-antigen/teichoic acid export membrane protein|nr:polysaccharide biosynthesis C-terminal domain-containing protein [Cytophagaceae bacterium]